MTPEELLLSVSHSADRRESAREALKAAEYGLYTDVVAALESGIAAHILAEVLGCERQNIYDMKKRHRVMSMEIKLAEQDYAASLAAELRFKELLDKSQTPE